MKAAGITEIKHELTARSARELMEICLRLAKAKKENKELLTYLLFEAHDPDTYLTQVKKFIDEGLGTANTNNVYILKKNLRRLLKGVNKYAKFTASKAAEAELLLYFCSGLRKHNIPYSGSHALNNLYQSLLRKIAAAISTLHEDLQHDYTQQLHTLR